MWIYRLGLERAKRLLLTGDALDGQHGGRVGPGVRVRPAGGARRRGAGARRAAWRSCPPTSSQMMKLLVNQAYEQMGLRDDPADRDAARRRRAPHARGRARSRRRRCADVARAPSPTATRRSATTARSAGEARAGRSPRSPPRCWPAAASEPTDEEQVRDHARRLRARDRGQGLPGALRPPASRPELDRRAQADRPAVRDRDAAGARATSSSRG